MHRWYALPGFIRSLSILNMKLWTFAYPVTCITCSTLAANGEDPSNSYLVISYCLCLTYRLCQNLLIAMDTNVTDFYIVILRHKDRITLYRCIDDILSLHAASTTVSNKCEPVEILLLQASGSRFQPEPPWQRMVPIERYIAASKKARASPPSLISAAVMSKKDTILLYSRWSAPHLGELFIHGQQLRFEFRNTRNKIIVHAWRLSV